MVRIKVTLIKPNDRKFFVCKWNDPITGMEKRKSTSQIRRREAERFAARLEDRLNKGETVCGTRTQWTVFRERYDTEVMSGQSPRTRSKADSVFDSVESVINPKGPESLDASQLSQYVKSLRESGRAEATIKGHLAYIKAALRWAESIGIIPKAPAIKMPSRVNTAKGRAITADEFQKLLQAIPEVVGESAIADWKYLLEGLWWSGLRRSEAWHLHWTDERMIRVDLSGRFPMFRINPEADKGFEARTFPIAPQFAEMLAKTPESQRTGYVFNPLAVRSGSRVSREQMSRIIGRIGEKSGIVVSEIRDNPKFVTAHDLRRSFGTRWSTLVMPAVLQKLMRHSEIATTMQFYVTSNAENTAESVWAASGLTLGITNKKETHKESLEFDVNPYG